MQRPRRTQARAPANPNPSAPKAPANAPGSTGAPAHLPGKQQAPSSAKGPARRRTNGQLPKVALKEEPEDLGIEAALWSGQDSAKSLELSTAAVEARLAELEAGGDEPKTEETELDLSGEKEEPKAGKSASSKAGAPGPSKAAGKAAPPPDLWKRTALSTQSKLAERLVGAKTRDTDSVPGATSGPHGSTGTTAKRAAHRPQVTGASHSNLNVVDERLGGANPRAERPPDAYALLREAKEAGVFFKEDAWREGHTEEQEDPELAAAVEEAIRLLFGVRGILRVGAGHNDKNEPIIVVVASNGFSEASLARVPESVHRFRTVVAIPFDLLPLRKDR